MTLSKWEKNGIKRIYVNGAAIGGSKLWFQADSKGKLIEKSFRDVPGYSGAIDKATDAAYKMIEESCGKPHDGYDWDFDAVFAAL
jgi:hypothetical protein